MMAKEFLAVLEEAGLRRETLLVANAYACMPNEPKRDVEERKAVNCCRPLLEKYTKALPPETPTLLLGKWALLATTGREKGLFSSRGFVDQKWSLTSPKVGDIADGEEQE